MTSRRIPVSSKWVLLLFLVPPLVLIGTHSDSVLSPLGWIGAVVVLGVVFVAVVRASGARPASGSAPTGE